MSFEIPKIESTQNGNQLSTSSLHGNAGSSINIPLNKNAEIKIDEKVETQIKKMLYAINPKINWEKLSEVEKQQYVAKYNDGSLQAELESIKAKSARLTEALEGLSAKECVSKIIDIQLARKYDDYETKPELREERIRKESLYLLNSYFESKEDTEFNKKIDIYSLPPERQDKFIERYRLTMEAVIYKLQQDNITHPTEDQIKSFLSDKAAVLDAKFAYAEKMISENPDILKNPTAPENRELVLTYERGKLMRDVANANGITLEEFRTRKNKAELIYKHLSSKDTTELNTSEQNILQKLQTQHNRFNGDMSTVRNCNENNIAESYLLHCFEGQDVDIHNLTLENIATIRKSILTEYQNCKTPEEQQTFIARLLNSSMDICERDLYEGIFAQMDKDGILSYDSDVQPVVEKLGLSSHMRAAHINKASAATQAAYINYTVEHSHGEEAEYTAVQLGGIHEHTVPELNTTVQAEASKTLMSTGYQEVLDAAPTAFSKMDQTAAKEAYEYAMNAENISAEQKAIIARDTIDITTDSDLKKFYQDLAQKYNIDYSSVPPKSERTNSNSNKQTNNKKSETVSNTNYTANEISNILNNSANQNQNIITVLSNGVKETLDIILGKTPDNDVSSSTTAITSLNSAISELKSGTKLTKVFAGCSPSIQKDLVELICTYGKTAIAQLIDAFGGDTIYKLAKTENSKALIKKEIKRIALSDATQRTALAIIERQEQKDGFRARA